MPEVPNTYKHNGTMSAENWATAVQKQQLIIQQLSNSECDTKGSH